MADDSRDADYLSAVKAGDVSAMNAALDAGANLYAFDGGLQAMSLAIQKSRENIADALLARGYDPNTGADRQDTSPLMVACGWGETGIAEKLLKAGAKIDYRSGCGDDALCWALEYTYKDAVHLLLQEGADPEHAKKYSTVLAREKPETKATVDYFFNQLATEFSQAARVARAETQRGQEVEIMAQGMRDGLAQGTRILKPLRLRGGKTAWLAFA